MRRAEVEHVWRKIRGRPRETLLLQSMVFTDIDGLGTGSLEFSGQITAVCGINGAGKTTIVHSLHAVLSKAVGEDREASLPLKVKNGQLRLVLSDERAIHLDVSTGHLSCLKSGEPVDSPFPVSVIYLDASSNVPWLRSALRSDSDIDSLIAGVEPQVLTGDELETVRALVGKQYQSVEMLEVEEYTGVREDESLFATEDDTMPFFRATCDGIAYDSRTMGLGELSLMFNYWALKRVPKGSIVLLEEPEQFISPRSQRHLLDHVAVQSETRNLMVLMTTHSAEVLDRLETREIRIAVPRQGTVNLQTAEGRDGYLLQLGVDSPKRGLILVEDASARAFLLALLEQYLPDALRDFAIVFQGGHSGVVKVLGALPRDGHDLRLCGVLDGDQRDSGWIAPWPILYLCGHSSPEDMLKATVDENDEALGGGLGLSADRTRAILGPIRGEEPHDWLEILAQHSNRDTVSLVRVLTSVWLDDYTNRTAAQELANDLEDALYGRPNPTLAAEHH